jgi:hypothetical protein
MLQEEYYIVEREDNDDYPLLAWDEISSSIKRHPTTSISIDEPLNFRLSEPVPNNPIFADFLKAPDPVVSEKFANLLFTSASVAITTIGSQKRNGQARKGRSPAKS